MAIIFKIQLCTSKSIRANTVFQGDLQHVLPSRKNYYINIPDSYDTYTILAERNRFENQPTLWYYIGW